MAELCKELALVTKIATHKVVGEFITNIEMDQNGKDFLAVEPNIRFVGKGELENTYISDARDVPIRQEAKFNVLGFSVTEYSVDAQTKALIAPVKATELVQLNGIPDQSLFAHNVRGPLGRTGVNRDIVKSIEAKEQHRLFPLFHNGITIIAKTLEQAKDEIKINDYFVVNGCQSLSSFYDNKAKLSDDLRVLTKFIQVEPNSDLAKMVTEISNNQNGVKPRDFMANHAVQIRLQNEFPKDYKDQYFFEIKRGEKKDAGTLITNEEAGLLLMAFDLEEPWATHRKYQVFDDKYIDLFAKKALRPTASYYAMSSPNQSMLRCRNSITAFSRNTPSLATCFSIAYGIFSRKMICGVVSRISLMNLCAPRSPERNFALLSITL